MDDELEKDAPKIQADNQSIAIGEINISGTVTGNITIGHTIVSLPMRACDMSLESCSKTSKRHGYTSLITPLIESFSKKSAVVIVSSTGCCWNISQRWGRRKKYSCLLVSSQSALWSSSGEQSIWSWNRYWGKWLGYKSN